MNSIEGVHFFGNKTVREDWVDLRDAPYEPALTTLKSELSLPSSLLSNSDENAIGKHEPVFGVRDQRNSSRCTGYALAAVIDIQTRLQQGNLSHTDSIASADMLYRMGAFHDRVAPRDKASQQDLQTELRHNPEGLRSLRAVLKGFYHHGACPDAPNIDCDPIPGAWRSDCYMPEDEIPDQPQLFPDIDQTHAARAINLGAYFRLRPILNHFHAALNEVGAVLVSAQIHQGWLSPFQTDAEGRIDEASSADMGAHAFVLVGYTEEGFLVLNSLGNRWGGFDGIAGVALWSYADWSRNVIDAWVIRLGVSAPNAFSASIGQQGWKKLLDGPVRSVPCHELVGHYLHLDDGFHVNKGPYPSLPESWPKTYEFLRNCTSGPSPKYKGLLIWIPGNLEGIEEAFETATRIKVHAKALDLYTYTLFWCSTFAEKSLELLTLLFESCLEQSGPESAELNLLIEEKVQGVGRAIWRDIERSAVRGVSGPDEHPWSDEEMENCTGYLLRFFEDVLELAHGTGLQVHIVTEGAGVLVLQEVLTHWENEHETDGWRRLAHRLTTLSMIMPAIDLGRAKRQLLELVSEMNNDLDCPGPLEVADYDTQQHQREADNNRPTPPARIYLPNNELEERLTFGLYKGSFLQLVSRAFEDRWQDPASDSDPDCIEDRPQHPGNPPRTLLGMAHARDVLAEADTSNEAITRAFSHITKTSNSAFASGSVPQQALSRDLAIANEVYSSIAYHCNASS